MAYAELIEEAKGLSEFSIIEVTDYIKFLKKKETESLGERKPNLLAGGLKFMAEDFDDTPECFKEYM